VLIVATSISALRMPYAKYFEGAQFVHFLLGTATVSLAVPVYRGLNALRGRVLMLAATLVSGAFTSVVSAVAIARAIAENQWKGRAVLVRCVWTDISPQSARMEQSFSADGGKTWEVNWSCELSR